MTSLSDTELVIQSLESIKIYTDDDYNYVAEVVTLCGKCQSFYDHKSFDGMIWAIRTWLFGTWLSRSIDDADS